MQTIQADTRSRSALYVASDWEDMPPKDNQAVREVKWRRKKKNKNKAKELRLIRDSRLNLGWN